MNIENTRGKASGPSPAMNLDTRPRPRIPKITAPNHTPFPTGLARGLVVPFAAGNRKEFSDGGGWTTSPIMRGTLRLPWSRRVQR